MYYAIFNYILNSITFFLVCFKINLGALNYDYSHHLLQHVLSDQNCGA